MKIDLLTRLAQTRYKDNTPKQRQLEKELEKRRKEFPENFCENCDAEKEWGYHDGYAAVPRYRCTNPKCFDIAHEKWIKENPEEWEELKKSCDKIKD
jgi:hypothetical protein